MAWDMQIIRGLSLTRPWPFAFTHAGSRTPPKLIENRSWPPPPFIIGGYLALHAAQSWDEEDREWIMHTTGLFVPRNRESPRGQIFGVCRVTGYAETALDARVPRDQRVWFFGPYGWLLDEFVELVEPVPCTGGQKLWTFDGRQSELHALRHAYRKSVERNP